MAIKQLLANDNEPFGDIGNTNSEDIGNTFLLEEVKPMPWKGVTVSERCKNQMVGPSGGV